MAARVIVDAARRRGAARVHRPRRALSGGQTGQQAAATLLAASAAPTWAQQALTPEAARRVVTPFYEMLNRPATKDLAALANASLSPDWKSYSGEQTFKARAAAPSSSTASSTPLARACACSACSAGSSGSSASSTATTSLPQRA